MEALKCQNLLATDPHRLTQIKSGWNGFLIKVQGSRFRVQRFKIKGFETGMSEGWEAEIAHS
jgi:hypothetical protein